MKDTSAPSCSCEVIHDDIVQSVCRSLPAPEVSTALSLLFRLFADPTRVRLLQCLLLREMCVCDLASALGVTKSAVSHHLRSLRLANIVRFRREGQIVFYALADEHVERILAMGLEHIAE